MPARSLYVNQEVAIDPSNAGAAAAGTSGIRYLPIQSASCEVTRPLEDILSFGKLGTLGRVQTAVSTCKADLKSYLPNATGITGSAAYPNLINASFLQTLTGNALAGQVSKITVSPNGFSMSGILSSLGIDISNGQFGTADMSFVGVGEPFFAAAPSSATFSESANMPSSFSPVTSTNVTGNFLVGGCPSSFNFSMDLPNETINCLGGVVTGTQVEVKNQFLQVGKPPFKTSVNVEGLAVDAPAAASVASATYQIGKLQIQLPGGQITSRSFNNSVGSAGGSYSYTVEDVSVTFSDQA